MIKKEVKKAKSINYMIVCIGAGCYFYLFSVGTAEEISIYVLFPQMVQFFLSGAITQAVYTYFIE